MPSLLESKIKILPMLFSIAAVGQALTPQKISLALVPSNPAISVAHR
jgi:hypothetical protein